MTHVVCTLLRASDSVHGDKPPYIGGRVVVDGTMSDWRSAYLARVRALHGTTAGVHSFMHSRGPFDALVARTIDAPIGTLTIPQLVAENENTVRIARLLDDGQRYTAEIRCQGPFFYPRRRQLIDQFDAKAQEKNAKEKAILRQGGQLCFGLDARLKNRYLDDPDTIVITVFLKFVGFVPPDYRHTRAFGSYGGNEQRWGFLLFKPSLTETPEVLLLCIRTDVSGRQVPSFWLGSVLLQYFERWIRYRTDVVKVRSMQEAVEFYEKNGYRREDPTLVEPQNDALIPMFRNLNWHRPDPQRL